MTKLIASFNSAFQQLGKYTREMRQLLLVLFALCAPFMAYGQAFLNLGTPTFVVGSGTDLQQGAQYRYSNALPGIDVLVTLAQFSSSTTVSGTLTITTPTVILTAIDAAAPFPERFQPVITCAGNLGARECFIRFDFAFVVSGTSIPTPVYGLAVSAQDVDGNNVTDGVRESVEFLGATAVTTFGTTSTLSIGTATIGGVRYVQNSANNLQNGIGTGNQFEAYARFTTGPVTGFSIAGGNVIGTAGCDATNGGCQRQNSYTFIPGDSNVPSVTVNKVSNGGTGTFTFTGTNGWVTQPVSTVSPGVTVSAISEALLAANVATTITESPPAGFTLESIACNVNGVTTGTPTVNGVNGGSIALPANVALEGNNIVCTFVNRKLAANLSITKANAPGPVVAGSTTTYTITAANLGPDSAAGAIVRDAPTAGLNCTTVNCASTSPNMCPAASFPFSSLNAGIAVSPSFPAPSTLTLTVSCGVTATGN